MPPPGFHTVTPRLVVEDVGAQVSFLRAVFDARGDVQPGRPAEVFGAGASTPRARHAPGGRLSGRIDAMACL